MNQSFKRFSIALSAFVCSLAAFAQVTTSSLTGRISDENGEPLPGAAIVAVHTPSGTQYASAANNDGLFSINGMRAGGPYKVEISFIGMAALEYNDITLTLGEPFEINAVMKVSNQLDAVTVVSKKTFNANMTGAGASFSRSTVESMPSIDRSVYDIVKYSPQASVGKNGGISFSGSNNRYNSFQIDGAVANDTFGLSASGTNGGQTGANPISIDAIEQIQVVIAPFDVRQSGFTGGAINAITKSGTNKIKGSGYLYFNNQDFIGTKAGPLAPGKKREKYSRQHAITAGATFGAPIIKNKLFVFASFEFFLKSRPNIYSPANNSYEEYKLNEDVYYNGENLGNVFNQKMAEAMIKKYKETYRLPGVQESFAPRNIDDKSINGLLRFDWNISDAHKLMVRYQLMSASADKYTAGQSSYTFANSSFKQSNLSNTVVAELNSRITPSIQNMFRVSGVFIRDHRSIPYAGATVSTRADKTSKGTFSTNIGTEYSSGANSMSSDNYTITDNLSWYIGKHELVFGTHNEIYRFNNVFLQYLYGGYSFNTLNDFFNDKIERFDFRYSDPTLTNGNTKWAANTVAAQFGLYVQDEWKPSKNFTLTYGLRMDIPTLLNRPTENPDFNKSELSNKTGEKVGVVPNVMPLFSPRLGFRWFLNDKHTTLLRGGAGLFTGRVPFVWLSNAYNNTGMESKSVTVNKPDAGKFLPKNFAGQGIDPYENIIKAGHASAGGKPTINTLSKKFKYPQVFRVNLGFEHTFAHGWKFTFDGLYSKNLNNVYFRNLALKKAGEVYAVNAANANKKNVAPYYNLDKTYYAVIALDNTNKGYSYSLSGKIEKHFNFGLDLMGAYTFGHSKSVNDGSSSVAYSNWKYNYSVDTNSPELAYSLYDRPHKVMAVVSYTSPVYGKMFSTNVSLSYTGESGQRYAYVMSETEDFNGDGQKGNSLMYVPTQSEIGQMNWEPIMSGTKVLKSAGQQAAEFEQFIRNDSYLNSHRGQWTERYAGIAPFENHFDLHIGQDIIYDRKHGRKIQLMLDVLNIANLLNRNWGLSYSAAWSRQILSVTSLTKDAAGNYTPSYNFNPNSLQLNDFYSRWRCQLGLRITF